MAFWCKTEDVEHRLEDIAGKGWGADDIPNRISRAMRYIKKRLGAIYSDDVLIGWDTTAPNDVTDLTADFAALIIKFDYIDEYKASDQENSLTFDLIKLILEGKADLYDNSGNKIARQIYKVKTNTKNATPIFSMGNVGEGTFGTKSLDDFGQPLENINNETE